MQYWLTIHWPQLQPKPHQVDPGPLLEDIYIKTDKEAALHKVEPGDRVLIYETRTKGPLLVWEKDDWELRKREDGKCGIVDVRKVITPLEYRDPSTYTRRLKYKDSKDKDGNVKVGEELTWEYCAKTERLDNGFVVSLAKVKEIFRSLGGRFNPRGPGLREVTCKEYHALVDAFKSNAPT